MVLHSPEHPDQIEGHGETRRLGRSRIVGADLAAYLGHMSETHLDSSEKPCGLCEKSEPLRVSHVLPAFVFKWAKETSATGYLRFSQNPNRRVQDGLKFPWLCGDCEGLLSREETAFATQAFHPINDDRNTQVAYEEWLLRFCVSVSWRVLSYYRLEGQLAHLSGAQRAAADAASQRWSDFLFGRVPHPGAFEQHIVPLDVIEATNVGGLPENINRYLARSIDMDLPCGKRSAMTFAKLGRFALFGFIVPQRTKWEGSKVHVLSGTLGGRVNYTLPEDILEFFTSRARVHAKIAEDISDTQHDKIERAVLGDLERARQSGTLEAMLYDERMFGTEAVLRRPKG